MLLLLSYFKYSSRLYRQRNPCSSILLCSRNYNFRADFFEQKHSKTIINKPKKLTSIRQKPKEHVLAALKSFTTVENFLEYLMLKTPDINLYGPIYYSIFELFKSGNSNLSAEDLCRTEGFESLSKLAKKNLRFMKIEDILKILEVVTFLGVSTNSILCQHLLQMISKRINRLGVDQIIFVNMIVCKSSTSPLSNALKISLPVVFESHIHYQLDEDNIRVLKNAISFAFQENNVSDRTRKMLIHVALKKIDQFEVEEVIEIMKSLSLTQNNFTDVLYLYNELIDRLEQHIKNLSTCQIINVVADIIEKYTTINQSFFHECFVKEAMKLFVERDADISDTSKFLQFLNKVSYYCPELLDHMDKKFKNEISFDKLEVSTVVSFVTACSNCTHIPHNWSSYESRLLSFLEARKDTDIQVFEVTTDLIILQCWPEALIEYCFQEDVMKQILKRRGHKYLQRLYQIVKSLYGDHYVGPDPPSDIMKEVADKLDQKKEYHLLSALQQGLGGSQYVLNGMKTKSGQLIDYLIVKYKSGKIYPVNPFLIGGSCDLSFESLNLPEDCYSIAIITQTQRSYTFDGLRLKGQAKCLLNCLKTFGITPIPVSMTQWFELEDCEKIPYIIDRINSSVSQS